VNTIFFETLQTQRTLFQKNSSLQPYLPKALTEIYPDALDLALPEASLKEENFPQECSYSLEEILNAEFFPGEQLESDRNW